MLGTGKNEKEMEECLQEAVESGLWGYKKPEIRVNLKNMEKLRSTFKKGGIEQLILI